MTTSAPERQAEAADKSRRRQIKDCLRERMRERKKGKGHHGTVSLPDSNMLIKIKATLPLQD